MKVVTQMKNKYGLISIFLISVISACTQIPAPVTTSTVVPTLAPTARHTITPSPSPSPTPEPQILGRVFPEGFSGQAVWGNADGNANRNFNDRGWFCPPDGSNTTCTDHIIHFDVSVPNGFSKDDYIISPVSGNVYDIYDTGDSKCIHIIPDSAIMGDKELINNNERIHTLEKSIFSFQYKENDLQYSSIHIAHLIPLVNEGDHVQKGQPLAYVEMDFPGNPKKIGYVIYLHMNDGKYFQFSPCDVPNDDEFCGKCTLGTPFICP